MVQHNKTYGYTIALWEVPNTAPSLFRQISAYKDAQKIPTTDMWRNMVDPSWAPFFLRQLMPSKVLRDRHGDVWNLCHYWGNFEIADMDFFRSDAYRSYFEALDTAGGFYYERVSLLAFRFRYKFGACSQVLTFAYQLVGRRTSSFTRSGAVSGTASAALFCRFWLSTCAFPVMPQECCWPAIAGLIRTGAKERRLERGIRKRRGVSLHL